MRRPRALRPHQRAAFFEHGYILIPGVFGLGDVMRMRSAFDHLEETATKLRRSGTHDGSSFVLRRRYGLLFPASIERVVWCGAAAPDLLKLGGDARLLTMAAGLLGSREMDQLINQAHFKLPGDGVSFPWHQDSMHRRYGTDLWQDVNGLGSYVQTITAVDAMTADNGPLMVIAGSCERGHIEVAAGMDGLPSHEVDESAAVPLLMDPGDVLLVGPYTIHGSRPNRSTTPRRALVNGYAAPGANKRVYPGDGAGRRLVAPLVAVQAA